MPTPIKTLSRKRLHGDFHVVAQGGIGGGIAQAHLHTRRQSIEGEVGSGLPGHPNQWVVTQVLAHARQIQNHVNAEGGQLRRWPDA